jgi:hypothetical protein
MKPAISIHLLLILSTEHRAQTLEHIGDCEVSVRMANAAELPTDTQHRPLRGA